MNTVPKPSESALRSKAQTATATACASQERAIRKCTTMAFTAYGTQTTTYCSPIADQPDRHST